MSKPILRRSLAAITVGGLLAVGTAPAAHADPVTNYAAISAPAVCSTLDQFPTIAGVTGVLQGVMEDTGFNAYDAGRAVGIAVRVWCPEHVAEVQRFVAVYSNAGTVRA